MRLSEMRWAMGYAPLNFPHFQKPKMGERTGISLPQIPSFGIWGRQEGVLNEFRTS